MAQDVIITPANGEIEWQDNATGVASIDIDASNTTAAVLDIAANALTTGTALNISTTATNDNAGSLVKIAQAGARDRVPPEKNTIRSPNGEFFAFKRSTKHLVFQSRSS